MAVFTGCTACCGGGTISTTCCPGGLPSTLYATITNVSNCSCADGLTIPLHNSGGSFWLSDAGYCLQFNLVCDTGPGGWCIQWGCVGGITNWCCQASFSCSPLSISFTGCSTCNGMCDFGLDGTFDVTVTT